MKNRLKVFWIVAGLAVIAGIAALVTAAPAIAQTVKAALVRDIDNQGRNAYQEHRWASNLNNWLTTITFSAVPAGKRLIVTHVSSQIVTFSAATMNQAYLQDQSGTVSVFQFVPVNSNNGAVSKFNVVNAAVYMYFDAGHIPSFSLDSPVTLSNFSAAISGYMIDMP